MKKLNVIINKNDIIIRNTERVPEDSIFKKLIVLEIIKKFK